MSAEPAPDPERAIADLRELARRTGGPGGARRVCWSAEWRAARELLTELLAEIDLEPEIDEAGNAWAYLPGEEGTAAPLALGSHLDSVPEGGWLDGPLGVMAGLAVLRAWAESGRRPPRTLVLVDWADEEGAFGRSLMGSAAATGTFRPEELASATARDGRPAAGVLAENGVELETMTRAQERLRSIGAYLELHIEQGPVLLAEGVPAAAVTGCAGLERMRFRITGVPSHAGTTPMDARRDAGLVAAAAALEVERIAAEGGGVGTVGSIVLHPGAATVIPGSAELVVDIRHPLAEPLAAMLEGVRAAVARNASERGCEWSEEPVWRIEPIAFDPRLVALARRACEEVAGRDFALPSGALHDAAEVARRIPAAMMFCPSIGGVSHSPAEDTAEEDLRTAIAAFGRLASLALA
ncbi:MAG TPA: Zn-dependent hydrolase [Solirubrobacterales bacterium]|nr:Zn-dependent hydrolase [Solirubrobacterales bacterium]